MKGEELESVLFAGIEAVLIFKSFYLSQCQKIKCSWAVVVAQLVEKSLPIPKVRGLNPVIGKNLYIY